VLEEKSFSNVTLSTTNLKQSDLGSNSAPRGDRPATNRLTPQSTPHIKFR